MAKISIAEGVGLVGSSLTVRFFKSDRYTTARRTVSLSERTLQIVWFNIEGDQMIKDMINGGNEHNVTILELHALIKVLKLNFCLCKII